MWLILAFAAMALVGVREPFKKISLRGNDTIVVLACNTVLYCLLMLPLLITQHPTPLQLLACSGKSALLLGCWLCSYAGVKHLPVTTSGIISAFGPVLVVIGAFLIFGEKFNLLQFLGIVVSFISLITLNRSSQKEGIIFKSNKFIWLMMLSTLFSAGSALYDKVLFAPVETGGMGMSIWMVQSWYNVILLGFLLIVLAIRRKSGSGEGDRFHWSWTIVAVSICGCAADLLEARALQDPTAMVSIISMIRRGSVIVSFTIGALILHEGNIRSKVWDLALVLLGLFLLFLGSL